MRYCEAASVDLPDVPYISLAATKAALELRSIGEAATPNTKRPPAADQRRNRGVRRRERGRREAAARGARGGAPRAGPDARQRLPVRGLRRPPSRHTAGGAEVDAALI